jgi:CRISPR-associated protein Cas2
MQQTFIVSYDISDPKRLRAVFKTMKGWGDHLQLSVFRCDLNPRELVELRSELASIIVDVGPADGRATTSFNTLGRPTPPTLRTAIVV